MGANDGGEEEEAAAAMGLATAREEKIFVSVRMRPLNGKEIARNDVSDWDCIGDNTIVNKNGSLSLPERSMHPSAYTFDSVFSCDCSTRQVYNEGAKEVVLSVVCGINSSIFAYGQTSSGKTFTMTGVTEYTIADIYDHIRKHTEREFHLKLSAMEIYNESVKDLLSFDSTPLRLLDDPERGTIVEKLTEETLRDWDHAMELLSICEAQRQIGETSLNETSSRSHQIIRLTVESSARDILGKDSSSTLVATVNFVDLAGSERASQSLSAGTRLKEGCHINRSLLTLGTVIRKLSKGRSAHIPFRDSKLTRILQSSLGGNARTAIICTMSPARSHVEQSRNTLLFASCAKEVSTNAQVNLVMSEKALVKHLQKELVRLESELRASRSTHMTSNCAALLREKDLQIEKMEKQMRDLMLQRDVALSQVQDLLRLVGDEGSSLIRVGSGFYPNLRVQRSPESEIYVQETSVLADPPSLDNSVRTFGSTRYSHDRSESSTDVTCAKVPKFEEAFLSNNASPRVLISASQYSEVDSCQGWDVEEHSNGTSEDLCKEVRCIETEELSTKSYPESNSFSPEERIGISGMAVFGSLESRNQQSLTPVLKENRKVKGIMSSLSEGEKEAMMSSPKEDGGTMTSAGTEDSEIVLLTPFNEDKESSYLHTSPVTIPEKPSQWSDILEDLTSSGSLKLPKSRSCNASFLESNENTPPNGSENDFIGRPQALTMKLRPLDYGTNIETKSKAASEASVGAIARKEPGAQEKISSNENITAVSTCVAGTNEMADTDESTQDVDIPAKESEVTANEPLKCVKDVGLDPVEDGLRSPSNWPSEFKKLQREIIELWHACNVSLVHRTYFFLLFKGDPTDSIYVEVELRGLLFTRSTFSQGLQTLEGGHTLTAASSMKALGRERQMLSRQLQKKLTEQEKESLYLKWGIGLSTKQRRLQLAYKLWTKTDDMDHVADSAVVVAKLVGSIEPGQAPKEIFGLSLTPRHMSRSHSLKRSLISLL